MSDGVSLEYRVESNKIPEVAGNLAGRGRKISKQTAEDILDMIVASFHSPKSGRLYDRPEGKHRASAPEEPPAIDEADLLKSMEIVEDGEGFAVISTDPKAPALEFGGKNAPRPFLTPAVEAARQLFKQALRKGLFRVN